MKGIRIKAEKEIPATHNYGRLVTFYCAKCGISPDWHYCSKCGNPLDFGEYYHQKANDDIQFEE